MHGKHSDTLSDGHRPVPKPPRRLPGRLPRDVRVFARGRLFPREARGRGGNQGGIAPAHERGSSDPRALRLPDRQAGRNHVEVLRVQIGSTGNGHRQIAHRHGRTQHPIPNRPGFLPFVALLTRADKPLRREPSTHHRFLQRGNRGHLGEDLRDRIPDEGGIPRLFHGGGSEAFPVRAIRRPCGSNQRR